MVTIGPLGSSASFDVATSRPDCPWTADTGAIWIHLSSASDTGPGYVSFYVDQNYGTSPRLGTITLADRTVSVSQQGVEISTEQKGTGGFGF